MKIYELIANRIQKQLNAKRGEDSPVIFSLKAMYDETQFLFPNPDGLEVVSGELSFASDDIVPLSGLNILTVGGNVSFVVTKENACEVSDVIGAFIAADNGNVTTIGEYVVIPTYTTPNRSSIFLSGQKSESIAVSFYLTYALVKNGYAANDVKITLDSNEDGTPKPIVVTEFSVAKTKTIPTDNVWNDEMLKGNPQTQTIAFEFAVILTTDFEDVIDEIMSETDLAATHTLGITIGESTYSYSVALASGMITGVVGGVLNARLSFTIVR